MALIVVFRSAKERPFAERKATMLFASPGGAADRKRSNATT
jgi:hypothetical protein